jgi:hypothetical protein
MNNYINIGSVPTAENCASVGEADYYDQTQIELKAYIDQLYRLFTLPEGAKFVAKSNSHDFGTYYEVEIKYPAEWDYGDDDVRLQPLYDCENYMPEYWDDEAKQYLMNNGYRHLNLEQ